MLVEIQKIYTDAILEKSAQLFGVDKNDLLNLGGFESFVYKYSLADKDYILKITHDIRRSVDYIMGELDFINMLAGNGVSVSRAIPSVHGNLVEEIKTENGSFLVYAFASAPGSLIANDCWTPALIQQRGMLIAQIHFYSKTYTPPKPEYTRINWYEEGFFDYKTVLPSLDPEVKIASDALFARLLALSKDSTNYGLTHGDLHQRNFFNDNGVLTAFDFDDCQYHWYVNDIAVALYYAKKHFVSDLHGSDFVHYFMEHFMSGYQKVCSLEDSWIQMIPDLMRIRALIMYLLVFLTHEEGKIPADKIEFLAKEKEIIINEARSKEGF